MINFILLLLNLDIMTKLSVVVMGLLAPNPRKFFEKNLTKNFHTGFLLVNILRAMKQVFCRDRIGVVRT